MLQIFPSTTFVFYCLLHNKDENVHRFALSVIRGELLREKERERERYFQDIIHGSPVIHRVKIKREIEREREKERERKRGRERKRESESERERKEQGQKFP